MNKTELVAAIAEKTSLSKNDSEKAVNAFTSIVTEELEKKGNVQLIGFGTFDTVDKPARSGRNPKTNEIIQIKAHSSVRFKAGKKFKDVVNNK